MPGKRPDPATLAETEHELLVIGGGITGAGVALQAARLGIRPLLLEKQDFAWGTSSRSTKMVHGGLRYIAQGDIRLTRESLQERERLIRELPRLVVRHGYLFPSRKGRFPGRWSMTVLLWLYDRLAGIRDHRWISREEVLRRAPGMDPEGLQGGMTYTDAVTDDSRLVLRTLHEAVNAGARVANYTEVLSVEPSEGSFQVRVRDGVTGAEHSLRAAKVINATGAWADELSGGEPRVRPLRGSHLFVPAGRLPVEDCVAVVNPDDGRPVFVFPWEGVTCIGTTDLDHRQDPSCEAFATREEVDYLLGLVNREFPGARLADRDVISSMAGVRPVITSGKGLDPSKERRDHAVWDDRGVITVSGGKLTTFRLIALDALEAAELLSPGSARALRRSSEPLFVSDPGIPESLESPLSPVPDDEEALRRMLGWALDHEMVVHLDDLLLRRTRLGLLRPGGAEALLELVRELVMARAGWDDARWQRERERYMNIIQHYYSLPQPPAAERAA